MAQLSLSASHYLIYKSAFTYNLVSLSLLWRKLPASFQRWKWKVKLLSRVQLFATPWTVAYQAPQSMEFSRQEYWSGLPFPSPQDLPDPGIKPESPTLRAVALPFEPPGKRFQRYSSSNFLNFNSFLFLRGTIPSVITHMHTYTQASLVAQTVKESACKAGDLDLIPGLGRSPGTGHGNPLQYSCLENPHGQRRLAGYSSWGHKESDTTKHSTAHSLHADLGRYTHKHTESLKSSLILFLLYPHHQHLNKL